MTRTHLLGAASAAALSLMSTVAFAQQATTLQGGGSTLAEFDYFHEFAAYNNAQNGATNPTAIFQNSDGDNANDTLYWPAGSGTGQSAFLGDTLNTLCLKVNSTNPNCGPTTPGGTNATHYGASDATLSSTQISGWASSSTGQSLSGNLIQLPSMGVGISFPVVNKKVTKNGSNSSHKPVLGGVVLNDDDLCGIFSGKISDWSQTSAAAKLTAGLITVVYRADGSGTSFLLLNHFIAACNANNSSFPLPITASTTFTSVFGANGLPVPPGQSTTNFVGESGSSGVASYLDNATGTGSPAVTSAIGYVSPDFTTVDPNSNAVLADGSTSTLVVAAVKNATNNLVYIPLVADITSALNSGANFNPVGASKPPTTAATGANPVNYVPLPETVKVGYPVVGYTTFDFAQCYQNPSITAGVLGFLNAHYSNAAPYKGIINNNGFVAVSATGAKPFAAVITNAILTNAKKWNDNIGNATACAQVTGR